MENEKRAEVAMENEKRSGRTAPPGFLNFKVKQAVDDDDAIPTLGFWWFNGCVCLRGERKASQFTFLV
jgi:hypothetical protein